MPKTDEDPMSTNKAEIDCKSCGGSDFTGDGAGECPVCVDGTDEDGSACFACRGSGRCVSCALGVQTLH